MEESRNQQKKRLKLERLKQRKLALQQSGQWKRPKRKNKNERDRRHLQQTGAELLSVSQVHQQHQSRFIRPYEYQYKLFAKQRWFGLQIVDMFLSEFGGYPRTYYLQAIEIGAITVNGQQTTEHHTIVDGDFIEHTIHRHEPPVKQVVGKLIEFEDDDVIVVNKPPTIPVHPCGLYRFNSMTFILSQDYNKNNLHTVHRLDRLTSGFVQTSPLASIVRQNAAKARELSNQILEHRVRKSYVAKVVGSFPSVANGFTQNLLDKNFIRDSSDFISLTVPIRCLNPLLTTRDCHEDGKPAETLFRLISFDGFSSVVECIPITGRTHQIRVHLAYLGHPIVNDPLYNSNFCEVTQGITWESVVMDRLASELDENCAAKPCVKVCHICKSGAEDSFTPTQLASNGIFLHAFKYESDSWKREVPLPPWAVLHSRK